MRDKRQTAALKIVRYATEQTALWYLWEQDDGQCLVDGRRMVCLRGRDKIRNLPACSAGQKVPFLEFVAKQKPLRELYPPLPDALMFRIREARAAHPDLYKGKNREVFTYDFGTRRPLVNAEYLRDMLLLIPRARVYECDKMLLLFQNDEGSVGLLMPLRSRAKMEEYKA